MFFRNDDKKDPRSKAGARTVPLLPSRRRMARLTAPTSRPLE